MVLRTRRIKHYINIFIVVVITIDVVAYYTPLVRQVYILYTNALTIL